MHEPGVENITLTQQTIDSGDQLTQLNELISDQDSRLSEIEHTVTVQEQYKQIGNLKLPFTNSYQLKYDAGKLQIDDSKLLQLHISIPLVNGKLSIHNTSEVYWLVRIPQRAGYVFEYDSQLTYSEYDKYLYIIVQPNKTLVMPIGVVQSDIKVFELPVLPFYSQRVYDGLNVKKPDNLTFTSYVDGQPADFAESYNLVDQNGLSVVGNPDFIDWQNSKIMTGHGNVKSGYVGFTKYFYRYDDDNYVRTTATFNQGRVFEVQDQQDGYCYIRPYTFLGELTDKYEKYLDLSMCSFDKLKITFLNGSNAVVNSVTPKRVLYQQDVVQTGVSGPFVLVAVVGTEVIQYYYESIQQFGQQYQFKSLPRYIWILRDLAGFQIAQDQTTIINLQYPQQQQIFLNTGKPQYITDRDGNGFVLGGSQDDMVRQFVQSPAEFYMYSIQNNTGEQINAVQFILEYTKIDTPIIQGQPGYQYKITLFSDADRTEFVTTYQSLNNQNIFYLLKQSIEQQDQSQHIVVDNKVKILIEPIDEVSGHIDVKALLRDHFITDQKWEFKPGVVYSTQIDCGVVV